MNEFISRKALLDAMPKNDELSSLDVRKVICGVPAADVILMRHGYWQDGGCYEICSVCGADHDRYDDGGYLQNFAYCPACGAKMDLEESHNGKN